MIAAPTQQNDFPRFAAALSLTLVAVLAGVLTWTIMRLTEGDTSAVAAAVLYAALCVWATCLLSLVPVAMLGYQGVMPTVVGYFSGTAVRFAACILTVVVLVKGMELPVRPVVFTLLAVYLPMLFVEVGWVGYYLWHKDVSPDVGKLKPATSTRGVQL